MVPFRVDSVAAKSTGHHPLKCASDASSIVPPTMFVPPQLHLLIEAFRDDSLVPPRELIASVHNHTRIEPVGQHVPDRICSEHTPCAGPKPLGVDPGRYRPVGLALNAHLRCLADGIGFRRHGHWGLLWTIAADVPEGNISQWQPGLCPLPLGFFYVDANQSTGKLAIGAHHGQHPFSMGRRVIHVFSDADKPDFPVPKTPKGLGLHRAATGPPV